KDDRTRRSASRFQDPDVLHVGIGTEANAGDTSARLSQDEGAIAGYLVESLIVLQLRRNEAATFLGHDNDAVASDHVTSTTVVSTSLRRQIRVARAAGGEECRGDIAQL